VLATRRALTPMALVGSLGSPASENGWHQPAEIPERIDVAATAI
jgi:hypothetical protein